MIRTIDTRCTTALILHYRAQNGLSFVYTDNFPLKKYCQNTGLTSDIEVPLQKLSFSYALLGKVTDADWNTL